MSLVYMHSCISSSSKKSFLTSGFGLRLALTVRIETGACNLHIFCVAVVLIISCCFFYNKTFSIHLKFCFDSCPNKLFELKSCALKTRINNLKGNWINCRFLQTHTELLNALMTRWLSQENIRLFNTDNYETKAAVVERFNRTLKSRKWRCFTADNT